MSLVDSLTARARSSSKTSNVGLRPMRDGDVRHVLRIERAAYDFPWTEGVFRDCLRVGYCCWVTLCNRQVAGYGIMSVAAGESHILNLCIGPERQGRGLGRRLLSQLLEVAKAHGAEETFLEVRPSNRIAATLYESAGFSQVGFRKAYYPGHGGREDARVMSRHL